MKKLIFLTLLGLSFVPQFFALAQNYSPDGNAWAMSPVCVAHVCTCNYPDPYAPETITTPTSSAECNTACSAQYASLIGSNTTYNSSGGTWDYYCTNISGAPSPTESGGLGQTLTANTETARATIFPKLNIEIPGRLRYNETTGIWEENVDGNWRAVDSDSAGGTSQRSSLIGIYVRAVYGYLLGAASLIAVTMLMIAGLQYATARGDSHAVEKAKKRISNAVVGVILLLLAYNIAFLIDPATTTFDSLNIQHIDPELYVQNSGDAPGGVNYTSIVPPPGVICDPSATVAEIAQSLVGNVTYRLGAKGGPPPYQYEYKQDDLQVPYSSYCPDGQLCFDCSGYVGYIAYCKGLSSASESGGSRQIFAGAEKVESCTGDEIVNGEVLNPGDLIGFPPLGKSSGHVFMYIGDGKVTDSAGSGRAPGRAVTTNKSTSWVCKSYMNKTQGLYVTRRSE